MTAKQILLMVVGAATLAAAGGCARSHAAVAGEERPAVHGNTEEQYQKNRRDEFNTSGSKDTAQTPK